MVRIRSGFEQILKQRAGVARLTSITYALVTDLLPRNQEYPMNRLANGLRSRETSQSRRKAGTRAAPETRNEVDLIMMGSHPALRQLASVFLHLPACDRCTDLGFLVCALDRRRVLLFLREDRICEALVHPQHLL